MKKLHPLLALFFLVVTVWAQSPQKMSYQAVVRNNDNSLVINRPVGVKISVLQGTDNGNTVYSELFNPNPETNANGLLTLEIGGGVSVLGTFSGIDWSKGPFFILTEIDPSGGSNYTVTGTTSLLSVPFALHAHSVENDKVDDADNDPANEIQQLNLSGTTLSLSKGGGSVNLPTSGEGSSDNWGTQSVVSDATLDGVGTSASPLKLADNAVTSAKIADGAVTGSKIESGAISADKIENGAVTGTKIAQSGASSGQVLKWDGSTWAPADDIEGGGNDVWQTSGNNIYRLTGSVGIGSDNPQAQLHVNGSGAGEGNILFEGLVKDEFGDLPVSGSGTRLMWYPDKAAFRAGTVTGDQWDMENIGYYSNAWGENTIASGSAATAWGKGTTASGTRSAAWGWNTVASGGDATVWGVETTAPSYLETVLGSYNTTYTPEGALFWNAGDRLFVIGNGTSLESRRNALTILKNGNTGIGTDTPSALLHAKGTGIGEGNVVFVGSFKSSDPGNPPISGAGTRMMWYPDKAALRAGEVYDSRWDIDSIGDHSTAWGLGTMAKGSMSTAWGGGTTASDYQSTAWGRGTIASGSAATAWGLWTTASSIRSTAWGLQTIASGYQSTAWGSNTRASGHQSTAYGLRTAASGFVATAWGENTTASGEKSTVWGTGNTASGVNSTAWGSGNTSTESYSSVWGQNNQAKGVLSTAWGVENEASGGQSTAWGLSTHAAGGRSTAWGYETVAHSANETALGHFSTSYIPSSQVNIVGSDRLFVIGNGTSNTNRSNALTVLKNGRIAIGNVSPVTTLHVSHGTLGQNVPPTEGLRLHNSGANNNSWTLYTVNSNGNLQFYANNELRGTFSATNGTYTSSSNRRLKTDITALGEDILKRTLQLEPVSYRFISNPQSEPTIGFIAEDVQPLFPELVEVTSENGENLGVNYAAFSVVAIKAIQQQQKQMEVLQTENEQLKKRLERLENLVASTAQKGND